MLNFTKEVFNKFAEANCGSKVGELIVTKQRISSAHTPIGHIDNLNALSAVIVIQGRDFYQTMSDINIIGGLNAGITYDSVAGTLYLDTYTAPVSGDHVIVFQTNSSVSGDFTGLFNSSNINLVSIDYVGSNVGYISTKGCNPSTFVEADMSNLYDYDTHSLNEINLALGQNIYFGNHNNISLGVNPFNVKKLILPDSGSETYTIPANCFAGCTNLLEVVIPDCVTAIGEGAFSGCINLQTVYIGSGVTNIGTKAFNKCSNIGRFIVDEQNPKYLGFTGCLLSKNTTPQYTYTLEFANQNWWSNQYSSAMKDIFTFYSDFSMPRTVNYGGTTNFDTRAIHLQPGQVFMGVISGLSHDNFKTITDSQCDGTFVTPNNKTTVASHLLSNPAIMDYCYVPIYYWITDISEDACSNDTYITSVNLSRYKSLMTIGKNSFKGCINLTTLTLPDAANVNEGSIVTYCNIGESAFEGCSGIFSTLYCYQTHSFGNKAFMGCAGLTGLYFEGPITGIGIQSFANTPNLASISTNLSGGNLGNNYKIWPNSNAIYSTSWNSYTNCIVVGCKNTSILACNQTIINIADYAFCGCSQYNPSNSEKSCFLDTSFNRVGIIGNYAFYGCTSLVLETIGVDNIKASAFYGCTSIVNLQINRNASGAKCFANSGLKNIQLKDVHGLADDAFEGCVLERVEVADDYVCLMSDQSIENCLLRKNVTNPNTHGTLLKSGNGKDIVNTIWNNANKVVTDIKDNAFTGVNMNNGSNTSIHVPSSVTSVGKNILSGSKFNNDVTGGSATPTLMLDDSASSQSQIGCSPSMALLWAIGAKYFKEAIVRTRASRINNTNHYYDIQIDASNYQLTMVEKGPSIQTTTVCIISFNQLTGFITAHISARLLPGYGSIDSNSHVKRLNPEIDLILMARGQMFNPIEQGVYLDSELVAAAGSSWQGYNIPNDFPIITGASYNTFSNISDSAFADCKWVSTLKSGRRISGENMFKGCTKLTTVSANGGNTYCDYNIFDGTIQKGMFDGCTSLTGIVGSASGKAYPIPIRIKQNAFKGCNNLNSSAILLNATEFGTSAFENTGLTDINLPSATVIDATAFAGCNLIAAKADSTCGYYFTGYGNCIVDGTNKIVVGAKRVNLNTILDNRPCAGIGDEAFAKRQYVDFDITNDNKMDFTIGKNAFAGSNLKSYIEENCSATVIDNGAFKNCQTLRNVILGSGCKLGKETFSGCTSLSIELPEDIDIPESCFSNCTSLTEFSVGGNIAQNAFNGCSSLSIVTMCYNNDATATIHPTAFIGCPITKISAGAYYSESFGNYMIGAAGLFSKEKETIIVGTQDISKLLLEDNRVNTIGANAYNGRGLTGVITIPATVTRIEDSAFANNPGITKVIMPSTVEYIGANAFAGCTGLLQTTLPDSCKFIGAGAFKGCPLTSGFNMNNVDDEYHISSVSQSAAIGRINNVSTLDLTKCTAYSIVGDSSFDHTQIEVVKLPETCVRIGDSAFNQCGNLAELHINSSSLDFGASSLDGCSRLRDVYFHKRCIFSQSIPAIAWCQGVGSSASHKTVHIPQTMNNSQFFNTYFYTAFSNAGYTFTVDM